MYPMLHHHHQDILGGEFCGCPGASDTVMCRSTEHHPSYHWCAHYLELYDAVAPHACELESMFVFWVLYQYAWGGCGLGVREPGLFTYSQFLPSLFPSTESSTLLLFLFPPPCHPCFLPDCPLYSHGVQSVPVLSLFTIHLLTFPLFPSGKIVTIYVFFLTLFELGPLSLPIPFIFCVCFPSL